MKIAIIPARGGSKRIPRKNIKNFAGFPLITYSIKAAIDTKLFDKIIVSSEDKEILDIAEKNGAEPFLRPTELADDYTGTMPVVRHAITNLIDSEALNLSGVCCIYATAPFVRAEDIRLGWRVLREKLAKFTFSATTFDYPVFRGLLPNEDGSVRMIYPQHFNTRSQDLPEAIHDAGQFYWGTPSSWLEEESLFIENSLPIILPRYRVQDIDTQEDWIRAEALWKIINSTEK